MAMGKGVGVIVRAWQGMEMFLSLAFSVSLGSFLVCSVKRVS